VLLRQVSRKHQPHCSNGADTLRRSFAIRAERTLGLALGNHTIISILQTPPSPPTPAHHHHHPLKPTQVARYEHYPAHLISNYVEPGPPIWPLHPQRRRRRTAGRPEWQPPHSCAPSGMFLLFI